MQTPLQIKLATESLPDGQLQVSRLEGRETISQLFEYQLLVTCPANEDLDAEALMGERATLIFELDEQEITRLFGMISVVHDRFESEGEHRSYRLTFVPRAYRLSLVETLDIFLDISVPDIIRQKLTAIGMQEKPKPGAPAKADGYDFEFRLGDSYPAREFVVQYKETDLAFISRLCEHIGVSFFFEHERGREVMVFTDANEGFWPLPQRDVPFRARGEHRDVYRFEETIRMIPADYMVRDYNYRTPQVALTGTARVSEGTGSVVEYGSHVKTPEEATKLAGIRAEERLAGRRVFEGTGSLATLRAGTRFTLTGHARGDIALLVTEVRPSATQATLGSGTGEPGFQVELKAIQQKRRFRPPRLTPKPRIHGVVTGVIDASDQTTKYADVDDQGRYRVKFLFDTTGPDDMQGSRLVRMAQPHSGAGYGMHFPLRPGVEVIITFVDGDPDRPIIAATVPNPQTASPVHSGNAPRNIIRTGGGNEINIDDTDDSHRIKLSTPHKSTTFQLGYRNAPENGAILETQGAQSTMATSGAAIATSVKSAVTVFSEWTNAGNIYSIAEFDAKWAALLAVVGSANEFVNIGIEMAKSGLEIAVAEKERALAELKRQSIKDQVAAQKASEEAAAKRKAVLEAMKKEPACTAIDNAVVNGTSPYGVAEKALRAKHPPPSAEYDKAEAELLKQPGMADSKAAAIADAKKAEWDKRVKPYEDKVDEAIENGTFTQGSAYSAAEKALRAKYPVGSPQYEYEEAQLLSDPTMAKAKEDFYGAVDKANPTLAAAKDKYESEEKLFEYQEKQEAYEKAKLTLRTDQEFLRDAKKGELTGTYTAETEYYQNSVAADEAALAAAKKELEDAEAGLPSSLSQGAKDKIKESKDADTASDTAWNTALASKKAYDEAYEDLELGDTAYNLKWAKGQLDIYGQVPMLFSVLMTIIGLIREIIEHIKHLFEKLEDIADLAKTLRRDDFDPLENVPPAPGKQLFGGVFFPSNKKRVKHVVGSSGLMKVSGEVNLYMEGGHAVLKGEKATTVLGVDKLGLYSTKDAELAAPKKIKLTSNGPTGRIDALAGDQISIESTKGNVFVRAKDRQLQLSSKGVAFLMSEDDQVVIRGKESVFVTSQEKNLNLTAQKAVNLESKTDAVNIEAKKKVFVAGDDGVAIDSKQGNVVITSSASQVQIKAKAAAFLESDSQIQLNAKKTLISGEVEIGDALYVKGLPVNPSTKAPKGQKVAEIQSVKELKTP